MSPVFAGFWIRALAHLIDFLIWNLLELAIEYGVTWAFKLDTVWQQVISVIATLVIPYLYYVEWPIKTGSTFGKSLLGIRVVDSSTGGPITRKQAIGRLYAYLLSYALLGCGFLMVAFHPQKRGLHEWISGTHSVRKVRSRLTSASDPTAPSKTDGVH
jgi:uncharacterized RDD family membrane protein YckC